ncbi:uncharacterized protein [Eucyclogobius newberryi]|uniref:uncharacterized protein isoform X2 n=1 Tax=Eucyclogobius newberryi TaxID=166745 RepID=UPI003B5A447B
MAGVNAQSYASQGVKRKFPFGQQQNQWKKRQPLQHSDDVVYTDGKNIQRIPSLGSQLKKLNDVCVIGLQYVWEYRSPSKSVPPHYHCKLCSVTQLQPHIIDHVKGWKHAFRYLKKVHPDKVPHEEDQIGKNQELKKTCKGIAMEVEKTEGRGQLKVILKEPCDVPAFKDFPSANPGPAPYQAQSMPFGQKSPRGGYRMEGFGGYSSLQAPDYSMDQGHYHDMGHDQMRDEYGAGDFDYGSSNDYTDDYRDTRMDRPMGRMQRPMNAPTLPQPGTLAGGDISGTLLSYLDTFRIESESDAQLVLKVTQKLTDVLMEYRLRRVEGPIVPPVFPQTSQTPTKPNYNEQYSGYEGIVQQYLSLICLISCIMRPIFCFSRYAEAWPNQILQLTFSGSICL